MNVVNANMDSCLANGLHAACLLRATKKRKEKNPYCIDKYEFQIGLLTMKVKLSQKLSSHAVENDVRKKLRSSKTSKQSRRINITYHEYASLLK